MSPTIEDEDRIGRAARLLAEARRSGRPIAPLPEDCRPRDDREAYSVQEALHGLLAPELGPVVGYKIGCTTAIMQERLGIDSPCAGGIFASTVRHGAGEFRRDDYVKVGVESEIAMTLGADLPAEVAPYTRESVAAAVESCAAAIEVVDGRYTDWHEVGVATLTADDFFGAGCVLGEPVTAWREIDLAAVTGITCVGGEEAGRGNGADVMGHPLEALAWLANSRAARGRGLRRGEFVLTGSIVIVQWPPPGVEASITVEGLGSARIRLI